MISSRVLKPTQIVCRKAKLASFNSPGYCVFLSSGGALSAQNNNFLSHIVDCWTKTNNNNVVVMAMGRRLLLPIWHVYKIEGALSCAGSAYIFQFVLRDPNKRIRSIYHHIMIRLYTQWISYLPYSYI